MFVGGHRSQRRRQYHGLTRAFARLSSNRFAHANHSAPGPQRNLMLETLDTINWSSLSHAHGPAADVPEMLRALASEDRDVRMEALSQLVETIWHQGTVFPASAAAVPFLCELLCHPDVQDKGFVVFLLSEIATGEGILSYCMRHDGEETCRNRLAEEGKSLQEALAEEAAMMKAIRDGVSPILRDLLPWLHDTEGLAPVVADALGNFPEHESWLVPAIDAALASVSDEHVRQTLAESRARLTD